MAPYPKPYPKPYPERPVIWCSTRHNLAKPPQCAWPWGLLTGADLGDEEGRRVAGALPLALGLQPVGGQVRVPPGQLEGGLGGDPLVLQPLSDVGDEQQQLRVALLLVLLFIFFVI